MNKLPKKLSLTLNVVKNGTQIIILLLLNRLCQDLLYQVICFSKSKQIICLWRGCLRYKKVSNVNILLFFLKQPSLFWRGLTSTINCVLSLLLCTLPDTLCTSYNLRQCCFVFCYLLTWERIGIFVISCLTSLLSKLLKRKIGIL